MDWGQVGSAISHFLNPIVWILLFWHQPVWDLLIDPLVLYLVFLGITVVTYSSLYTTREVLRFKREHDLNFGEFYGALVMFLCLLMLVVPFGIYVAVLVSSASTPPWLLLVGIAVLLVLCGSCCCCKVGTIEACIAVRRVSFLGLVLSYVMSFFAVQLYGAVIGPWAYWLFQYTCAFIFGYTLTAIREKI